jgi:iron(II)-dependent oxidoreductase
VDCQRSPWRRCFETERNHESNWTIVNRNEYDVDGRQISVPYTAGMRYYDLYHGTELTPEHDGDQAVLTFPIEAHEYAALLATPGEPGPEFVHLMDKMKPMTAKPLVSYSHEWKPLPQQLVEIPKSTPVTSATDGMTLIPEADYLFKVKGNEVEGFNDAGVDVQYPWEDRPRRYHEHKMHIAAFSMDKYPVTNADFKRFLDATHIPRGQLCFQNTVLAAQILRFFDLAPLFRAWGNAFGSYTIVCEA